MSDNDQLFDEEKIKEWKSYPDKGVKLRVVGGFDGFSGMNRLGI